MYKPKVVKKSGRNKILSAPINLYLKLSEKNKYSTYLCFIMKYKDMSPDEKEDAQIVLFYYASFMFMVIFVVLSTSYVKDTVFALFVSGLSWMFLIQFFFINKYQKYYLPMLNPPGRVMRLFLGRVVKSENKRKDIIRLTLFTLGPLSIIFLLKFS